LRGCKQSALDCTAPQVARVAGLTARSARPNHNHPPIQAYPPYFTPLFQNIPQLFSQFQSGGMEKEGPRGGVRGGTPWLGNWDRRRARKPPRGCGRRGSGSIGSAGRWGLHGQTHRCARVPHRQQASDADKEQHNPILIASFAGLGLTRRQWRRDR
jgi:hypothetical protein